MNGIRDRVNVGRDRRSRPTFTRSHLCHSLTEQLYCDDSSEMCNFDLTVAMDTSTTSDDADVRPFKPPFSEDALDHLQHSCSAKKTVYNAT